MVFRWWCHRHRVPVVDRVYENLPTVTVQIPIYNEHNVAGRVIDQTVKLDYPGHLLQIQVVDDSTDDTFDLIAIKVKGYQQCGVNIQHIHRTNRQGYKAGALRDAMATATGELIAIFDADFVPQCDFLVRTVHAFTDPKLAMVQTRWGHLNRDSNRLTKTQAMMLDSHFALEQQVRYGSGMLFNFNGTAGIWRKAAIIDAGNWSADTLTEDLDLSFRAQLKGWRMSYMNDLECPAEIPSNLQAFKSQQHRWVKGGIQVMKKLLGHVWRAPLALRTKLEATFHLYNNFAYFVMLLDTLLFLIPSLIMREYIGVPVSYGLDIIMLMLSSGSHLVYLYFGQVALNKPRLPALVNLPWLLLLGVRLAFNNARAAWEALIDNDSEFVRTPKNGEELTAGKLCQPPTQKVYRTVLSGGTRIELLAVAVFFLAFIWAVLNENWYMLPFLGLLLLGFSITALDSLRSRLATL